jgi:predicted GNAT family acetyltransferase
MASDAPTEVTNAHDESRYEIRAGAELAGVAEYRVDGDRVIFTHTLVESAYEGQGLGSALIRAALDGTRAAGRTVVPRCPFVRAFIDGHAEYADLVAG